MHPAADPSTSSVLGIVYLFLMVWRCRSLLSIHILQALTGATGGTIAAQVDKAPLESYADVGGLEAQVQEIKEAVELPLTHPELYEDIGIKPPKVRAWGAPRYLHGCMPHHPLPVYRVAGHSARACGISGDAHVCPWRVPVLRTLLTKLHGVLGSLAHRVQGCHGCVPQHKPGQPGFHFYAWCPATAVLPSSTYPQCV